MFNFQPDDFGENPGGEGREKTPVEQCPHCSKPINADTVVCPHCNLPIDELIQVDLHPEFPYQRLRRLLQPRNIILAVVTVAMVLGLYGFFVIQRFSSEYYIASGDRFLKDGNYTAALESYQQAVQFGPQKAEAYERLGWAEYQLSLDADALKHFEGALSLNPDQMMSLYGAGLSAYRLRYYENAVSYLNHVIAIAPGYGGAYEYLGLAEYRLGNYEAAYENLNEAWVYNPQNAMTNYYLGRVLTQSGDADLAIEYFDQAWKLGFDSNAITYARGLAWMQTGNYESARDDLQNASLAYPTRGGVTLAFAKSLYLLGDFPAAGDLLIAMQADVPPSLRPDYFALSGWTSLRQGHLADASGTFNLWVNLEPNNGDALNALGWATYYSGNCQTAKFYFESALRSKSEWVNTRDSLPSGDETPQMGLKLQCH